MTATETPPTSPPHEPHGPLAGETALSRLISAAGEVHAATGDFRASVPDVLDGSLYDRSEWEYAYESTVLTNYLLASLDARLGRLEAALHAGADQLDRLRELVAPALDQLAHGGILGMLAALRSRR